MNVKETVSIFLLFYQIQKMSKWLAFSHNDKFPGKSIIFGKVRNLCSLLAIGTRCIFGNGEKKA